MGAKHDTITAELSRNSPCISFTANNLTNVSYKNLINILLGVKEMFRLHLYQVEITRLDYSDDLVLFKRVTCRSL